ncbi:MAG: SPOR domain-containing protein [Oscillospiraceae bacterium]|nr:SPOR domain-containing protein [Oscillospiraceae bacterium]
MRRAVAESDAWGAEVHYVSHTNASTNLSDGVGQGKARGYRPIIFQGSQRGERLALFMTTRRREVYDGQISLNRRTDLYELRMPKAVSYYEEHVFHDNPEDAQWFHNNLRSVARSAAKGLCDYFNLPFVEPYTVADPPEEEEVPNEAAPLYRVQIGAFRSRSGAEALLSQVRAAGFGGAFIATVSQ